MESRLEANRANWDERVPIHAQSAFYDVAGWLERAEFPPQRELDVLGDMRSRSLVHLQCHFGMDTLRWARAGAVVTGVDFSPVAIDTARALATRAGLADSSTFVCANVLDAPEALAGRRFDVVYVSLGSLCWLPDVAAWATVVADLLEPGGRVYVHDVHPFSSCLNDGGDAVIYGYFEEVDQPFVDDGASTYTDGDELTTTRTYEWNHSLSEIVTSLQTRGLRLDSLEEHDWTVFQQFPWLRRGNDGRFTVPKGRPRIPLTFSLLAHARG